MSGAREADPPVDAEDFFDHGGVGNFEEVKDSA